MKSLYQPETYQELISRLNLLHAESPNQWGKMDAAQMLAHCSCPLKLALGDTQQQRSFIGRLLGGFVKKTLISDKPFDHNMPTDKGFIVSDERDFEKEKYQLMDLLRRFHQDQGQHAPSVHPFFGKMNVKEWDVLQYKHLDHHLRQFGC